MRSCIQWRTQSDAGLIHSLVENSLSILFYFLRSWSQLRLITGSSFTAANLWTPTIALFSLSFLPTSNIRGTSSSTSIARLYVFIRAIFWALNSANLILSAICRPDQERRPSEIVYFKKNKSFVISWHFSPFPCPSRQQSRRCARAVLRSSLQSSGNPAQSTRARFLRSISPDR